MESSLRRSPALHVSTAILTLSLFLSPAHLHARGLTPELASKVPRIRLASLPFPSPIYDRVDDPLNLGSHQYDSSRRAGTPRHLREVSRGTFYSKRAGFLDVGHIRKTVDWTAYIAWHTEAALRENKNHISRRFYEPSLYRISFNYPPRWSSLSPEEKDRVIPELAIIVGQRATYAALTWHEIITWYGYKATLVIPERNSAFCYDDILSHLVGIKVAGDALRDPARPYNDAVTHALDRELLAARPVSHEQEEFILESVKNNWWAPGDTLKRFLHIGYPSGPVTPWLVNDAPFNPTPVPLTYRVPPLNTLRGLDLTNFLSIQIDPRVLQKRQVLRSLPPGTKTISPHDHFPLIIETIRAEAEKEFGPFAANSYPPNPVDTVAARIRNPAPNTYPFSPRNRFHVRHTR